MKNTLMMLAAALLLLTVFGTAVSSSKTEAAPAATEEMVEESKAQTLTGEWIWRTENRGDLEAIFTPSGDNQWDVSFHFEFRDEAHTYTGTAEGDLATGSLSGRVQNENKKRTWTFSGDFDNGVFHGDHVELREEGERPTGTLTLSR